jgi:hypothetical protein
MGSGWVERKLGRGDVEVGVVLARESSRQSDSTAEWVEALGHVMAGLPPSSDEARGLRVAERCGTFFCDARMRSCHYEYKDLDLRRACTWPCAA